MKTVQTETCHYICIYIHTHIYIYNIYQYATLVDILTVFHMGNCCVKICTVICSRLHLIIIVSIKNIFLETFLRIMKRNFLPYYWHIDTCSGFLNHAILCHPFCQTKTQHNVVCPMKLRIKHTQLQDGRLTIAGCHFQIITKQQIVK